MTDESEQPEESLIPERRPDYVRLLSFQQCEEAIREYAAKHHIIPVGDFATRMLWEIHHGSEMVIRLELFHLDEPPT